MERENNLALLIGDAAGRPVYSHRTREGEFWRFPLAVERLSGAVDTLNILARRELLAELEVTEGRIGLAGRVRSYNNRSGRGAKLVLTVEALETAFTSEDCRNSIFLSGALCKEPIYRKTPMGREIADLMLAVNRERGGSDYLPVIVWGDTARRASGWHVGQHISLTGRMQSRLYTKYENGIASERTAFEISAASAELIP